MEYIKKDMGSYLLHMIKTDKYKTITVRVIFRKPIIKEEITKRRFLSEMLLRSNETYKTKRDIAIRKQELYAAGISQYNERIGNYNNSNFILTILNEKYTEEGMLKESIAFLSDLILKPNVINQKFDSESFRLVHRNILSSLQTWKEDKRRYSMIRMLENLDENSPISYHIDGYLEDLDEINEENLYTYYKDFLQTNMIDIFIIGDIDFYKTEEMIKDNFKFYTSKKQRQDTLISCSKASLRAKTVIEEDDTKQSKLAIGCYLTGLTDYERKYPLSLYSVILGGGSDSKFFKNIREKNSLAYYISSSPRKMDSILVIQAGISKDNFSKTVKLVKKDMLAMKKGDFSEDDMEKAKQLYRTALDEIEDSPKAVIESYYAMELLGIDDIEVRREKITQVTKEEIVDVSKKVKMAIIYLLEGVHEDEEV